MQDTETRRTPASERTTPETRIPPAARPNPTPATRRHGKHAWLALGLTGLLGAVWAVAIANRYPHILPG
ncbi:hypothetical protein ASF58_08800 [Methylobacterium sp. Leaf125]|jgi:hypothetical protein|uniref:hypothetical protein n=1 Tax=unclassified Methylobacterium TaxID=2615210 RepID=UPI0006FA8CFB|nr:MULTISPECIES: hypothetical protein [unclassified Methylobacterium]KQQ41031.1 hypothetical protein ASF58_08800 [Methylobacterium sp. Leaf125]POR43382.1 hypothetical protein CRT23_07705 [Methylobacterium sp. V23]